MFVSKKRKPKKQKIRRIKVLPAIKIVSVLVGGSLERAVLNGMLKKKSRFRRPASPE